MEENTNPTNNQSISISDIIDIVSTIDLIVQGVQSLMHDFGDQSYDKSLDIKVLMNSVVDTIANRQFSNDQERAQVKDALQNKLKPAVNNLRQFYINRKNYLSAEYDVLTMTEALQQSTVQAEQSLDNQDNSQSQSQSQSQGKVRTLTNPNAGPSTYPIAA
jgi:hypothetical protein